MRIGILSDSHDRTGSLQSAINWLVNNSIDTLFHCGDVTSLETARVMAGLRVHYVYGNGDFAANTIRDMLVEANHESTGGPVFSGELEGVAIAATHGHLPGSLFSLITSRKYDFVFFGHTHVQKDLRVHGTHVINPGALGSSRYDGRTLCILDLNSGQIEYPLFE